MDKYHKIESLFMRADERPHPILWGRYRNPAVDYLKDAEWIFTEKIDGMNIRVYWDGYRVSFGGRTDNAQLPPALLDRLNDIFAGETNEVIFEQKFGDTPVMLYGEGFGPKIQNGGGYSSTVDFILFDVYIGKWLIRENVADIANTFGIRAVPIIRRGTLSDTINFVSNGFTSAIGDRPAEGLVGYPKAGLLDENGNRIIVKLKTNELQNAKNQEYERLLQV